MKIDALKIHDMVIDCLFKDGEDASQAIVAPGIRATFHFHPGRLNSHRDEVRAWLMALPHGFRRSAGGGWTFLNACVDEDGVQWGEHPNMEELFCLGLGLGLVKATLPREMWTALPGGMPYYTIEDRKEN